MTEQLVNLAIEQLGIDVPVLRVEVRGNALLLWLYGRSRPTEWQIPTYLQAAELFESDDLTRIVGIGRKTAERLQAFGVRTFVQLAAADVEAIRGVTKAAPGVILNWQKVARGLTDVQD